MQSVFGDPMILLQDPVCAPDPRNAAPGDGAQKDAGESERNQSKTKNQRPQSMAGCESRRSARPVSRPAQGWMRCPVAALISAWVRVATPSFLRAFSR